VVHIPYIKQVKQEKNLTIISITHDLSEALESDHVVIMNKGKVYKEGLTCLINESKDCLPWGSNIEVASSRIMTSGLSAKNLSEALESDHVVIMNKGKVYKEGKPNFIFLNTQCKW
jgi:ABC-type multidrug transport system ATPase subunit